jgi:DNA-binding transcriptional ArsR family regulator
MSDGTGIPRIANLLAGPTRATLLKVLIDGTTRPAGELAYAANISAQSASAHLAKLVDGGLLASEAQGRHRYFRIASAEIVDAVESLAALGVAVAPLAHPREI